MAFPEKGCDNWECGNGDLVYNEDFDNDCSGQEKIMYIVPIYNKDKTGVMSQKDIKIYNRYELMDLDDFNI